MATTGWSTVLPVAASILLAAWGGTAQAQATEPTEQAGQSQDGESMDSLDATQTDGACSDFTARATFQQREGVSNDRATLRAWVPYLPGQEYGDLRPGADDLVVQVEDERWVVRADALQQSGYRWSSRGGAQGKDFSVALGFFHDGFRVRVLTEGADFRELQDPVFVRVALGPDAWCTHLTPRWVNNDAEFDRYVTQDNEEDRDADFNVNYDNDIDVSNDINYDYDSVYRYQIDYRNDRGHDDSRRHRSERKRHGHHDGHDRGRGHDNDRGDHDRHDGDHHDGDRHDGDRHDGDRHDGDRHDGDRHDGDRHDGDRHDGDHHDRDRRDCDRHDRDRDDCDRDGHDGDHHKH